MKELTVHEVQAVSGGWAKIVGEAFVGWILGDYVFEPIRDYIIDPRHFNNIDYEGMRNRFYEDHRQGRPWYGPY